MFSSVVSSKALTASENSVVLYVSAASDVVFSSNVSLGEELDSDDLQADNSPKETHRSEMIIAANINFVATLVFFIIKSPLCIKLDSLSSAAARRI